MPGIAFCGLKHPHVFDLIKLAKADPETVMTGAYEADPEYAAKAKARLEGRFYDSYEQLLGDPAVDIVAIGDAYGSRGGEAIRALEAGKHILSDKPLCTKAEELERIRLLCAEKGLCAGCMLDLRYDPALRLAAELIGGGALGEIHAVNFTGQHPLNYGTRPDWYFGGESHGGTFNDLIIHGVDAVSFITGLRSLKVHCARQYNAFAVNEPSFRDCAQLIAEYENGAGLVADVSYSAPGASAYTLPSYWRFDFWGEKGMIECTLGSGTVLLAKADAPAVELTAEKITENCLTDLVRMIRGQHTAFSQESLFLSAQTALMIQARADAYHA